MGVSNTGSHLFSEEAKNDGWENKSSSNEEIDDFGEHIGGSRKELALSLSLSKIETMTQAEIESGVRKDKIWNPSKEDLKEDGYSVNTAAYILELCKNIPNSPFFKDLTEVKDDAKLYFSVVEKIKSLVDSSSKNIEARELHEALVAFTREKYYLEDGTLNKEGQAAHLVRGLPVDFLEKDSHVERIEKYDLFWGQFLEKKARGDILPSDTLKFKIKKDEYLSHVEREGKDYLHGKNATEDDFLKVFAFRGGEFGNWMNQEERQLVLNHGFNSLMDLSTALQIAPKGISLNGTLSIAFGARGNGGSTVAHYEPAKKVINLTKPKGAGSLAHEWFHAYDNFVGTAALNMRTSHIFPSKTFASSSLDLMGAKYERELVTSASKAQKVFDRGFSSKKSDEVMKAYVGIGLYSYGLNFKNLDEKFKTKYVNTLMSGDGVGGIKLMKEIAAPVSNIELLRSQKHRKRKGARDELDSQIVGIQDKYKQTKFSSDALKLDNVGKRSKLYYSKDIEKAARAFEVVIGEILKEKGIRNDYLVNPYKLRDTTYLVDGAPLSPYPSGKEKKAFVSLFKKLRPILMTENLLNPYFNKENHLGLKKVKSQPLVITISGTRGAGKTTLSENLKSIFEDKIHIAKSATTRQPRDGEDGDSYHFMDRKDFLKKEKEGYFIETSKMGGNLYGTPTSELEKKVPVILVLDPIGVKKLEYNYDVEKCWMDAPEETRLSRMIESRGEKRAAKEILEDKSLLFWVANEMKEKHSFYGDEGVSKGSSILSSIIQKSLEHKTEKELLQDKNNHPSCGH